MIFLVHPVSDEGCNTNFTGCTTSSADIALPPAKLHNNPSIAKFHNFIEINVLCFSDL